MITRQDSFKYILGAVSGIASAGILAFALSRAGSPASSFLVLFAYIAAMPLFVAGFGLGSIAGLIACVAGTISLFSFLSLPFGVFYLIADALPAAVLIALAMQRRLLPDGTTQWSAERTLLAFLAIYPCLIFLAIYAFLTSQGSDLLTLTSNVFDAMGDQVHATLIANGENVTPDMTLRIKTYLGFFARLAPAFAMCAWLMTTLISMIAAQGLLRQRGWNLRPSFALANVHVPSWGIYAAALTGIMAGFAPAPYNYIGINLAIVLGTPLFFAGLAVIHAWAARLSMPTLALTIFYIALGIIVHLVLLVAVLGAVDQWVDFRKKLADRPIP